MHYFLAPDKLVTHENKENQTYFSEAAVGGGREAAEERWGAAVASGAVSHVEGNTVGTATGPATTPRRPRLTANTFTLTLGGPGIWA